MTGPGIEAAGRRVPRGLFPRVCVAALLMLAIAVVPAGVASAHTDFDFSDPEDNQVLDEPVASITIAFTNAAEPAGDGFQVLGPDGELVEPASVDSADGKQWVLTFDPALAGGDVGVKWSVRAGDTHPIDGSFVFTAGGSPAATSTTVAPGAPTADPTAPPATVPAEEDALEEFLADGDSSATDAAEVMAAIARIVTLLGVMTGVGALVFGSRVLDGSIAEVDLVLRWTRRASLLAFLGAAVELVAAAVIIEDGQWSAAADFGSYVDVGKTALGVAIGLRMLGALALWVGARPLAQRGATDAPNSWNPNPIAVGGALAILVSYAFDGHTVTEGNRALISVSSVVHVAAGAVWVGGIVMLAVVVRRRRGRRASARAGTVELAARFSVLATVALVVVGLFGVLLAGIVLDSPSQLWDSSWGRLLLVKVALVAIAAGAGAYNHFRMVPALREHADDAALIDRFASVLRGEAVALVGVVIVTGLLVGAST